jgi:hypothetical protein
VFVGLTAYDTQRIKEMYVESDSVEIAGKKAIIGPARSTSISSLSSCCCSSCSASAGRIDYDT